MPLYALVVTGTVRQVAPAIFDVASGFAWTSDISAVSPEPQVGWAAEEAGGVWTFTAPAAAPAADTRPAAKIALDISDVTIVRCYEHGVAVPAEWVAYRTALRAIVSGSASATPLPTKPAYPAGT